MSTTTTYDVALRYRLDDKAGKGADELAHKLGHAAHQSNELSHALGHLGALAGGALGIHGLYKGFVEFNKEVENAKISLTAMVEGGFGGSFQWARGQAEALFSEFQKFSQQTPMTTKEMLEFSRSVAMGVQGAGGSIKDIINVTEQGAVAAKAYGFEASLAGREITEMLQGNIKSTEPFTKALASAGHKSLEDLRAMTAEQRLVFLKSTLNSPALKDAVASMSTSFSGVTSTLVDKLEILMGKVGLPLFKAITNEVGDWNKWIDKNEVAIDHFASSVANGLVDAFHTVKEIFTFIYDHSDTFIAIGKVWAAIKIGNMLGGGLLGGSGGLGGMLGNLGTSTSKLGVGQVLGPAMTAGLAGYELGKLMGLDKVGESLGDWAAHLTGRTNKFADSIEQITESTKLLEQAQHDAATRMGQEGFASRMQGVQDQRETQIAALSRALGTSENDTSFAGIQKQAAAKDALKAAGVTDMDINQAGGMRQLMFSLRDQSELTRKQQIETTGDTTGLMSLMNSSLMTDYQRQTLNEAKAQNELFGYMNMHLAKGIPVNISEVLDILRNNTADPEGKHKNIAEKPKVNVTIHRIEVQSDDPDRFVFGMVQSFRDAAKNPSSALATLREG